MAWRKPGWFLLTALLMIASYFLLASPASAQTDPTQLLQQFTDAFNRHDAAGVAAMAQSAAAQPRTGEPTSLLAMALT
jgi:hypothetical protein